MCLRSVEYRVNSSSSSPSPSLSCGDREPAANQCCEWKIHGECDLSRDYSKDVCHCEKHLNFTCPHADGKIFKCRHDTNICTCYNDDEWDEFLRVAAGLILAASLSACCLCTCSVLLSLALYHGRSGSFISMLQIFNFIHYSSQLYR